MKNIELTVLALALFATTVNIYAYSWFESHSKWLQAGLWVMRITGILPGLAVTVWAMYVMATSTTDSSLGTVLLTSGLLLVAGSIELLAMLKRKLGNPLESQDG